MCGPGALGGGRFGAAIITDPGWQQHARND